MNAMVVAWSHLPRAKSRWDVNRPLTGKNAANEPFTVTGRSNPATNRFGYRSAKMIHLEAGTIGERH